MPSDAELLAAYADRREETAFAEIARRHGTMVYRVCLRTLGDAHEAEDASQATFVVLARKARSLVRGADLAAWLHGTARNVAAFSARSRARRVRREEEAAMVRAAAGAFPEVSAAERSAALAELDREVGALSPVERQALVLRYLEGRSQEEAAEIAGVPRGTLARRASDGLARLRERLARREVSLGAAALAGVLAAEAQAGAPATLLPSLLAASKLAAAGAAAGAAGTQALVIAEGAMKAMFWIKVKIAAAVLAAAAVVGTGTPLVYRAVAADAPGAAAKDDVIKAKVIKVEPSASGNVAAFVTIDKGLADGVKAGFEFDITRDGKLVNRVTVTAVEEKTSKGADAFDKGPGAWRGRVQVGDLAVTRLTEVIAEQPKVSPAPAAGGEAVNGLKLTLVAAGPAPVDPKNLPAGWKPGPAGYRDGPPIGVFCPKCHYAEKSFAAGKMPTCPECGKKTMFKYCSECSLRLGRCIECGAELPSAGYRLRWENVGKEPLIVVRRSEEPEGEVFLRGPEGKMARQRSYPKTAVAAPRPMLLAPGKPVEEPLDPWTWVEKPRGPEKIPSVSPGLGAKLLEEMERVKPGECTLWVEHQSRPDDAQFLPRGGQKDPPATEGKLWTGKVKSNEVKVALAAGAAALDPKNLPAGWRLIGGKRLECPLMHPLMSVSYVGPEAMPKCPECGARYNNGKLCEPCSVKLGRCATCGAQMAGAAAKPPPEPPKPAAPEAF